MNKQSYIPAAFKPTILSLKSSERDGKYINPQKFNKFITKNTAGCMMSFGDIFGSSNINKNYKNFIKDIEDFKHSEYTKGIGLVIDSGGFQILSGNIKDKKTAIILHDKYYQMLVDNPNLYSRAFILDYPLNTNIFSSWKDVEDWNEWS